MAEDIVGLNEHVNAQLVTSYLSSLTMAFLLRTDAKNDYIPELATVVPTLQNGGISRDGKTIVYHLRTGAVWSDGQPFTAADVAFSIRTVLNPANNEPSRQGFDQIVKVDEPNKTTVVVHLKRPYADAIGTFFSSAGVPLLPAHLLAKLPDINHAEYNALPVGIGPFVYKEWRRGDRVELTANPTYFRGRPKLDRIVFKIIPDRNTALAQLQTHEVDLWLPVPGNYLARVTPIAGVSTLRREAFTFNHIDFVVTHPAVSDPVVRRALRMATDRATLRQKIGHGLNILSETPFGPSHPAHVTHPIPLVPFDIAGANRLLDAAAWKVGADGVRAKNGVRLELSVGLPTGTPDTDQQIELIRSWWKQIGVALAVQHFADALFFAPFQAGGTIATGRTDISFYAWGTGSFGDLSNIYSCAAIPPHGENYTRYCNRAVDAAMDKQIVEYDPRKRLRYSDFIQQQLFEDAPSIITSVRENVFAYNSDLRGFAPNQVEPFDGIMNVDI